MGEIRTLDRLKMTKISLNDQTMQTVRSYITFLGIGTTCNTEQQTMKWKISRDTPHQS